MMRPVLTREEYLSLRDSDLQRKMVSAIRNGDESLKGRLVQMNYSCLPNDDDTLKGCTRMSTTIGMDIDHIPESQMETVKESILAKKEELGLLMLELSARGRGYHLVFRRRPSMSQEDNLRWASTLLGVDYDAGAKDITRVFFTTTASAEDLIYLDNSLFEINEEEKKIKEKSEVKIKSEEAKHPTEFKGIPYGEIIAEYWRRMGGEPTEGERNDKLHKLAANLRAICDDKEEWLLEVMPRYGLPEAEMRSIIHSACKEPTKGSKLMQSIIDDVKCQVSNVDIEEEDSTPLHSGRGKGVGPLPIGLKESLIGVPESMHMPVLCAVLPIAGAYADQVEVEYCDGQHHRLGLMSIIRGEQASNKSICKTVVDVWKRQFDQEDALARQREDEWKEKRKGRKANEKAPEDPRVLIRMVPVTVSCSTLLKRLKYAQGHCLYSFGEELDTLRKTNGAGSWSSKYDIYRMAFDNGEWGQDYNSDQAESGVVNVAYNWTMLGTYGAVRRCFKSDNIENGLSSRVLMAEMPDGAFARLTKFRRRSEADEERIQEAVTKLRSYSGFIDTPRLRKAIEKWVESKRVIAAKNIDYVMDTYRKRAAVIGFRCGVIHHLLWTHPNLPLKGRDETSPQEANDITPRPLRERKGEGPERTGESPEGPRVGPEGAASIRFAIVIAEYCLEQQMKAFGETLRNEYVCAKDECQRYGVNHSVFDQLPPLFSRDELRALKNDCTMSGVRNIVMRWKQDGWIEKIDSNHWRKTSRVPSSQRPI